MKTIYKYPFEIADQLTIEMPHTAKVLDVQLQRGVPVIWALIETDDETTHRRFRVYGTGRLLPDEPGDYIATFQQGSLVWHVFEQ